MSGDESRGEGDDDADGGARGGPPKERDGDSSSGPGAPPGGGREATEASDGVGGAEDGGDWRYTLEDLADRDAKDGEGDDDEGEGITGVFGPSEEIEPGEIDRESVVFVLLGAIVAGVGLYLMVAP
ncbi:MAG: hypothetical protein V5A24_09810 [Haloarculaceae archaeon]